MHAAAPAFCALSSHAQVSVTGLPSLSQFRKAIQMHTGMHVLHACLRVYSVRAKIFLHSVTEVISLEI